MTVVTGHFTFSPEPARCKAMLSPYDRECELQGLQSELPVLSHGEPITPRFFVGVWPGESQFDDPHRQIITDGLNNPVFP